MEGHKVHLHASGNTLAEALASLGVQAGAAVSLSLESFSDDQLLTALRQRMATRTQKMVVRIVPFSDEKDLIDATNAEAAAAEPAKETTASPRGRGRPPNASKQISEEGKAIAAEKAATEKRETPKPVAKAVADEWDEDPAGEDEVEVATNVTKEDVKAALNTFNAVKGMVTARQMLERIGGSQKLMDIDAKHYPAIVAEIKRELAATSKAAA